MPTVAIALMALLLMMLIVQNLIQNIKRILDTDKTSTRIAGSIVVVVQVSCIVMVIMGIIGLL